MTETPSKFDDGTGVHTTHWEWHRSGGGGWRAPTDEGDPNVVISTHDPAWDRVRDAARNQYGDPHIDYSADSDPIRHLVFGDGKPLPTDGTLVYRGDNGHNWVPYANGKYAPADENFQPTAAPFSPAGYKLIDGHYAPINSHGEQIGPQAAELPHPTGWHVHDNIWTPQAKDGSYYEITNPSKGERTYFDKGGHPITEPEQPPEAANPTAPPPASDPAPPDRGPQTPNTGPAADAIKKLEAALKDQNSNVAQADRTLAEAVLNAYSSSTQGKQQLKGLQQSIEDAVNQQTALDTPMGAREFQKFLLNKQKQILDTVARADLDAKSQKEIIASLNALTDTGNTTPDRPDQTQPGNPITGHEAQHVLAHTQANDADTADPLAGLLGDPGLLGGSPGMLGGLTPQIPTMPTIPGIPGLGGGGIPNLFGSGGSSLGPSPLTDMLKPEHSSDEKPTFNDSLLDPDNPNDNNPPSDKPSNEPSDKPGDKPSDQPQPGAPVPASLAPPTPPGSGPTPVQLPNGLTVTADNPQVANFIKEVASGTPVDQAARHNGLTVAPAGAAPPHTIDPSGLTPGAIGQFTDHQVVALGKDWAIINGQIRPISDASGPGFLGWMAPPQAETAPLLPSTSITATPATPEAPAAHNAAGPSLLTPNPR
jgi:uncharacterized protein DUF4226